ncbi:hypothetical protein TRFO_29264 [Tritrichomonas foetus]|uniref:Uncharacterized protein n=1 Tax=Tritrichomonas foetus TaxID=1144522 RepID=A0A1J4JW31_9EUKA|nr:hypothetical protein TRFO_29264 [Tritrichomonas foetus]|eukprot:OHT03345.1 hypothetical protein TRFO_29264 [Tritrichomonas foetus]
MFNHRMKPVQSHYLEIDDQRRIYNIHRSNVSDAKCVVDATRPLPVPRIQLRGQRQSQMLARVRQAGRDNANLIKKVEKGRSEIGKNAVESLYNDNPVYPVIPVKPRAYEDWMAITIEDETLYKKLPPISKTPQRASLPVLSSSGQSGGNSGYNSSYNHHSNGANHMRHYRSEVIEFTNEKDAPNYCRPRAKTRMATSPAKTPESVD